MIITRLGQLLLEHSTLLIMNLYIKIKVANKNKILNNEFEISVLMNTYLLLWDESGLEIKLYNTANTLCEM